MRKMLGYVKICTTSFGKIKKTVIFAQNMSKKGIIGTIVGTFIFSIMF